MKLKNNNKTRNTENYMEKLQTREKARPLARKEFYYIKNYYNRSPKKTLTQLQKHFLKYQPHTIDLVYNKVKLFPIGMIETKKHKTSYTVFGAH